jgi:hypothetical protein
MRRTIAVLLVASVLVPQVISAQAVMPGTRVRVAHPGEGIRTGTLVALTADTLEVRLAGHAEVSHVPLAQVTRLDVSLGKQRRLMRFAGVGLVVGGAVGAATGAAAGSSCDGEFLCPGAGGGAVLGGVFLGSVGGIIGLIAGVVPTERWERVPLEARRISLVTPSSRHGHGVGLKFAF